MAPPSVVPGARVMVALPAGRHMSANAAETNVERCSTSKTPLGSAVVNFLYFVGGWRGKMIGDRSLKGLVMDGGKREEGEGKRDSEEE